MSLIKKMGRKGFTLIELMIVVAIIGILAAVAIPKFADLVTKSKEASVKGSLGAVRSAVSIYYGDTEGTYPANLHDGLTSASKYMPLGSLGNFSMPKNKNGNGGHDYTQVTATHIKQTNVGVADDTTALLYVYNNPAGRDGEVFVNCTHNDTKNLKWSSY